MSRLIYCQFSFDWTTSFLSDVSILNPFPNTVKTFLCIMHLPVVVALKTHP
jgi:hypothetical protein